MGAALGLPSRFPALGSKLRHYMETGREFAGHDAVNHTAKEYVRYGEGVITTNTVEGH